MDKNGHGTRIAGIVGGHRRGEEFTGGKSQVLVRRKIGKFHHDLTGTSLE